MLRIDTPWRTSPALPARSESVWRKRALLPSLGKQRVLNAPLQRDTVCFSRMQNVAGPIPPESLVLVVPGMAAPSEAMTPLNRYFQERGHQTKVLPSPASLLEGNIVASVEWLAPNIDEFRLREFSDRYVKWVDELAALPKSVRRESLRRKLQLDHSAQGKAVSQAALDMMFDGNRETDYTALVRAYKDPRQPEKIESKPSRRGFKGPATDKKSYLDLARLERQVSFDALTTMARENLSQRLWPLFLGSAHSGKDPASQWETLNKTVDHVMDQIAPRVVVVGHSMGGFVGMLTLFSQRKDISMVVGLSSPGENGIDEFPSGTAELIKQLPPDSGQKTRDWLVSKAPAINHMTSGSLQTRKLKANHQPFNSTIMAVGMAGDIDGLVGERNFRLNDALPGRVNLTVTPMKAEVLTMNSEKLGQFHELAKQWNPIYRWVCEQTVDRSVLLQSIAYHSGLVQFQDQYWSRNGDMIRAILEAPKNDQGAPDYQNGKPDYPEAIRQIRRVLHRQNSEAVRAHFLDLMLDYFQDTQESQSPQAYRELLKAYQPIVPDLAEMAQEKQPIENGVRDKAQRLLRQFQPETGLPQNALKESAFKWQNWFRPKNTVHA